MKVSSQELKNIKRKILGDCNPSSSHNLEGMEVDLNYFLDGSNLFKSIRVKKTGNVNSMIETQCKIVSAYIAPDKIADTLEEIWLNDLCFQDFEAYSITCEKGAVVLDFVTFIQLANTYITGNIIVGVNEKQT